MDANHPLENTTVFSLLFDHDGFLFAGTSGRGVFRSAESTVPFFVITATAGAGGSIAPSGNVRVNRGENQTFTVTANNGYFVDNVMVDATSIGNVSTYTFSNVQADHTISALFITPAEAIQKLIDRVDSYVASGVLSQGRGNSLRVKLESALKQVEKGHTNSAVNLLQAFISEVEGYVNAGKLSAAQGELLTSLAQRIIGWLSGFGGKAAAVSDKFVEIDSPTQYVLDQNFPNPFNPQTVIRFSLPDDAKVTLNVFNVLGEEVARLVEGERAAGAHQVVFDASKLPSGLYVYRLDAGTFTQTRRMLLIR